VREFKVGDIVERREWIGTTSGEVVEVKDDERLVVVRWRVGLRLAGRSTTDRMETIRKSG
jgi:hypothetical protein